MTAADNLGVSPIAPIAPLPAQLPPLGALANNPLVGAPGALDAGAGDSTTPAADARAERRGPRRHVGGSSSAPQEGTNPATPRTPVGGATATKHGPLLIEEADF